ncbi:hypothetical protein TIFTF001_016599 [Ficus carica]|uniref:Uncharacterized protein n=1 Tax=Ficus carica TaxID=3494 RepID=A0AA88D7J9_FICCA|nr:hypothetical protein TIFTF001_016599 [Ficus carica]
MEMETIGQSRWPPWRSNGLRSTTISSPFVKSRLWVIAPVGSLVAKNRALPSSIGDSMVAAIFVWLNPLLSWPEDVATIRGDHDFHRVSYLTMTLGRPVTLSDDVEWRRRRCLLQQLDLGI